MRDEIEDAEPSGRAYRAERTWLAEVERTWKGLAPPGALPRRRDLDAASLGAALAQSFTIEEVAPGTARVRVAGQRLQEWFGADPRGVPLSAMVAPESRTALREALYATFGRPAVVELALTTPRGTFRAPIAGRMLLLPLQNDDGTVTRALGAIALDLAAPMGPRRLTLAEGRPARVEPVLVRPVRPAALTAPAFELAEAPRPWLRLVVSND